MMSAALLRPNACIDYLRFRAIYLKEVHGILYTVFFLSKSTQAGSGIFFKICIHVSGIIGCTTTGYNQGTVY
jgi:hypothetical protein